MDWRVFAFTTTVGVADRPPVRRRACLPGHGAYAGRRAARSCAGHRHRRRPLPGGPCAGGIASGLAFVLVFGSMLFVRTLVSLTSQEIGSNRRACWSARWMCGAPALGLGVACSSIGRCAKRSLPFPAWKPRRCHCHAHQRLNVELRDRGARVARSAPCSLQCRIC